MKKIKIFMILLLAGFLTCVINVYAKNITTLSFINANIENNQAIFDLGKVELFKKKNNNYEQVNINNNSQVDLDEEDYYLKVTNTSNKKIVLMINEKIESFSEENYYKLDSNRYNGGVHINLKEDNSHQSNKTNVTVNATSINGALADISINSIHFNDRMETTTINVAKDIELRTKDEIVITAEFGKVIESIKINNQNMDVTNILDMATYTVNHEKIYNIEVVLKGSNTNINMPISWDYNGKTFGNDALIQNGSIEIVSVRLKDGTLLSSKQIQEYVEEDRGFGIQKYGKYNDAYFLKTETTGEARIKPGLEVTIKLVPEYGYQLTSTTLNGTKINPIENTISTFTFIMPSTPLHLSALFSKVDDKVKVNSNMIKEGTIKVDNQEIDSGSVVLNITDTKLNKNQIKSFENAAKYYNINSYLDINLEQVLYKGVEDDVWQNDLTTLNKPATISLKLEEKYSNDIIIIHEKHDKTYEIIPVTYNSKNNTVTFETTSFSNYAIASKNEKSNFSNPKTIDNFVSYIILFIIATVGIIGSLIIKKHY